MSDLLAYTVTGGAHLERIGKRRWHLECTRTDGSIVCVILDGRVLTVEERPAPEGDADG